MKFSAIALIASLALVANPVLAAQGATGDNASNPNPSNAQQMRGQSMGKGAGKGMGKFSPRNLSRAQIKKIQTALDNGGFNAGKADGEWGPRTQKAGQAFLKSKNKNSVSQLSDQDLASIGLNRGMFATGGRHYGSARSLRNQ